MDARNAGPGKHDAEECAQLALRSISCQTFAASSSDKLTTCKEHIDAYKACRTEQHERKRAERLARLASPAPPVAATLLALLAVALLEPASVCASPMAPASADLHATSAAAAAVRAAAVAASKADSARSALHTAVLEGAPAADVRALLAAGLVLDASDRFGYSPLHYAASEGREEIVALLLAAGAAVGARDNWRETPLHKAASRGHVSCLRLLLDAGADIAALDTNGRGPLIEAASQGHIEACRVLVAAGADAEAVTSYGSSALSIAQDGELRLLLQAAAEERAVARLAEDARLRELAAQVPATRHTGVASDNCDELGEAERRMDQTRALMKQEEDHLAAHEPRHWSGSVMY